MSADEVSDLHTRLSAKGDMLLTISFNMALWVFHMNHFLARIFDLKRDGCFWEYIQTNIAIGNWCFENCIPFVVTWTVLRQLLTRNMSTWGGRMHGQLPDRVAWRHILAKSSWHPKYVLYMAGWARSQFVFFPQHKKALSQIFAEKATQKKDE